MALKNGELNLWSKENFAPEGYAFPGDPRNWEQKKYKKAKLSVLGKNYLKQFLVIDLDLFQYTFISFKLILFKFFPSFFISDSK